MIDFEKEAQEIYKRNQDEEYPAYASFWMDDGSLANELRNFAAKVLREDYAELATAALSLCEWVPDCSKGSSGYLRKTRVKELAERIQEALA